MSNWRCRLCLELGSSSFGAVNYLGRLRLLSPRIVFLGQMSGYVRIPYVGYPCPHKSGRIRIRVLYPGLGSRARGA